MLAGYVGGRFSRNDGVRGLAMHAEELAVIVKF